MTPLEVLREAEKLVEEGWCQGVAARTFSGFAVTPNDPDACSWCLTGAISKAAGGSETDLDIKVLHIVFHHLFGRPPDVYHKRTYSVSEWNDFPGREKAEVLKVLRDCQKEQR